LLSLVKPQFELPADRIAPGGLVVDEEEGKEAVQQIMHKASQYGFVDDKVFPSALRGAEGNQEYFVKCRFKV
jgi:23S rRNA (cytidine1920-2'-O)/16S rRNA (cytidine1409-2'-O)-methyltransferase